MRPKRHQVKTMEIVETDKGFQLVLVVDDDGQNRTFLASQDMLFEEAVIAGERKVRSSPVLPWRNPVGWMPPR